MSTSIVTVGASRGRVLGSPIAWGLLVVGVVALLVVGSSHRAPPTRVARIAYLESIIKCPTCDDISIAQSTTQGAAALRHEVATLVDAGDSNAQVEAWVASHVGTDELLAPGGSNLEFLLVVIPVAALALGLGGLAFALARRRRIAAPDGSDDDEALVAAALGELGGDAPTGDVRGDARTGDVRGDAREATPR